MCSSQTIQMNYAVITRHHKVANDKIFELLTQNAQRIIHVELELLLLNLRKKRWIIYLAILDKHSMQINVKQHYMTINAIIKPIKHAK